jgi:uncharacterized membrane protein YfcA
MDLLIKILVGFGVGTLIGMTGVGGGKGTVRRKVVVALIIGSAPGSYLGVSLLVHLRNVYGNGVNHFITIAVGALLICIPTFLFFQKKIEDRAAQKPPTMKSFAWMSLIGLVAGFLVGITSVGSGSIVMMMMLLFFSFQPKVMVGTDIVHALLLTGVTSLLHMFARNVDFHLVGALVMGSIPGGLFGSYLSTRVPVPWLRRILCAVLLATGARMLMA